MRYTLLFVTLFFFLNARSQPASAPADTAQKNSIDRYVKYMDSLLKSENKSALISTLISEGPISQETKTVYIDPVTNEPDTQRTKLSGGWSCYTHALKSTDIPFKTEYHDNVFRNLYLTCYFKEGKIVYARLSYESNEMGKPMYRKEEYYHNDKIIFQSESKRPVKAEYLSRINIDLASRGYEFYHYYLRQK